MSEKANMPEEQDKYKAQKKYLSQKKQLRVWVAADKFEKFKNEVANNGDSIYGLINNFIDEYLQK